MKLVLIRHGPAEARETFALTGRDDSERPLIDRGRRRTRRAARGLNRLVPALDVLATSPLVRAAQTAEIVAEVYGGPKPVEVAALEPGRRPPELAEWLAAQDHADTVAVVGHEPGLGEAITWFLSGLTVPFVGLKKGGASQLDLPGEIDGGRASLDWVLAPGQLRKLG
jgi:phosphohistidine phosphatase